MPEVAPEVGTHELVWGRHCEMAALGRQPGRFLDLARPFGIAEIQQSPCMGGR